MNSLAISIDVNKLLGGGSRSTRYRRLKKYIEEGVVYKENSVYKINIFSPIVWRREYESREYEYTVYKAINIVDGIATGVRVASSNTPNPYSDLPIYEVYIPVERADLFAAVIGLDSRLQVYPDTRILYKTGFRKPVIIAYPLNRKVYYEEARTPYGFYIREAILEQALIDMLRGDFWFYEGYVFEIYYYIRQYIDPYKLLSIAKNMGLVERLYTLEFIVADYIREKPLFDIKPSSLVKVNLLKVVGKLGDVVD